MTDAGRRFALLGDPVEHSLSPRIHGAAFAALEVDATYVLERVAGDGVPALMRKYASAGGGNVTVPHKERAADILTSATDAVRVTGACNCFWQGEDGSLAGDNTDVAGIGSVVAELFDGGMPEEALVIGAGGAGAAAAVALFRGGVGRVRITNRTPSRAERLVRHLRRFGYAASVDAWPAAGTCDIVINATTLGLSQDDPPPASFDRLKPGRVLDLVYPPIARYDAGKGSAGTAWVRAARRRGIRAEDGIEVLVRQAAACYPHWFGRPVPVDVLRRGLGGGPPR